MKKLITLFLLLISFNAHAVTPEEQLESINNQNRQIQYQQQFEQEKIRQKELDGTEKEYEKFLEEEQSKLEGQEGKVVQDLRSIQCFRIREIIFSPNKIISKRHEKILTKDYLGKCLTLNQIAEFGQKISDDLVERGYVTSRAEIPSQNLLDGILKINITESYLENLILNEEKFFDKTQKFFAFGFIEKNKILNLRKVEQGLEQMNRLPSNNAVIKILPGSAEKTSIIAIENTPHERTRLNISYDNNGKKITGTRRETIGLAQDNLFWINDNFNISRTANDLDQTRKKNGGTNALSSSFSVPFTWYNLTLSYSKSSYFFWGGDITPFKSSGETATKTVALDRILLRDKKIKLVANFAVSSRYNQSFIDDEKIQVSSRKATIGSIGLTNTFFFTNANLFLKPSYQKALNILDAKKDEPGLPSDAVHAEFDIFKFYGNYSQKFSKIPSNYSLTFDSQISKQKLYSIDQFSVGGVYSVRGFKDGSIAGDSGYSIRNELNFNLGNFFSSLNHFSVTPFYDYGYIRMKGGRNSGRLSGTGFKLRFNHKNLTASLDFSWALSKSLLLDQYHHDNGAVYFNISSDLGFF